MSLFVYVLGLFFCVAVNIFPLTCIFGSNKNTPKVRFPTEPLSVLEKNP